MAKTRNDWDYQKLCSILKRWSFDSKMKMAFFQSKALLAPEMMDPEIQRNHVLPCELETFVMLSIKNQEWKYDI